MDLLGIWSSTSERCHSKQFVVTLCRLYDRIQTDLHLRLSWNWNFEFNRCKVHGLRCRLYVHVTTNLYKTSILNNYSSTFQLNFGQIPIVLPKMTRCISLFIFREKNKGFTRNAWKWQFCYLMRGFPWSEYIVLFPLRIYMPFDSEYFPHS